MKQESERKTKNSRTILKRWREQKSERERARERERERRGKISVCRWHVVQGPVEGDFQITRFNICLSETYPDRLLQSLALLSLLNLAWQASEARP